MASQASQNGFEPQEAQTSVDVPPHMSHPWGCLKGDAAGGSDCTTSWAGGAGMEDISMEARAGVGVVMLGLSGGLRCSFRLF